jgi:cell wall-associated NlpC family hydrolase
MISTTGEIIERARSLVGTPFQPQGRDPLTGLDCIGVVLWSFAIPAASVRRNYRLRGLHRAEIEAGLRRWFRRVADEGRPGDVMLFGVSSDQDHLAVNCGNSFVHADVSLRRVVEAPMPGQWPLTARFCRRTAAQPE